MALTQVNSGGIEDGSIVNADIKSDAAIDLTKLNSGSLPTGVVVNQQNIAGGQLVTAHIAAGTGFQISNTNITDDTIDEAKLDIHAAPSGTDKFLGYTSNGMEWTTVPAGGISDVVSDTSPQLGGDLDTNGNNIDFDDSKKARFGASEDLRIYHHGGHSYVQNDTGNLYLNTTTSGESVILGASGKICVKAIIDGAVELSHNEVKQCETSANGLAFPSGKGIDFSANSHATGMSSETLDDYEEGSWTPDFYYHSSVSSVAGHYTKIGRMVYAYFTGTFYSTASDGQYISNLPFVSSNDSGGNGGVARGYQNYDIVNGPIYFIENNTTRIWFYKDNGVAMPASDGNGMSFRGVAIYHTSQ